MIDYIKEWKYVWDGLPRNQKINIFLAAGAKLGVFVSSFFLGLSIGQRLLVEKERNLILIILLLWYINSWAIGNYKAWYKNI